MSDIECAACYMVFGVPDRFHKDRLSDGRAFYCPNGHTNFYTESESEKIRRERDLLRQQLAQRDDAIVELQRETCAAKNELGRLQKRTSAGTCPCCRRSFQALARHMAAKHPTFRADGGADVVPLKPKRAARTPRGA